MLLLYAFALTSMTFRLPMLDGPALPGLTITSRPAAHPWVLLTPWKSETEHDVHDHAAE